MELRCAKRMTNAFFGHSRIADVLHSPLYGRVRSAALRVRERR